MHHLYGNGINDDSDAIQALLDSGSSLVALPTPQKHYFIGKTLRIHSNQTLALGEMTTIRLLPGCSCPMLTNAEKDAHDIAIHGGIWDYDNINQAPNPFIADSKAAWAKTHADGNYEKNVTYDIMGSMGCIMTFDHVTRFSIHDLTMKNPVTYCLRMAYMQYFTVENIRFDQNLGNPTAENMDGIHIDGGCRFGSIRNIQGTCYDDMVALNANDCYDGPIEDIHIDGVFGEHSLRGVRLLATKSVMARISISNVFGTFYQNAIGLTYFYPKLGIRGQMSHISIKNIFAENAPRRPEYNKRGPYRFSQVWVDGSLDVDLLTVDNLCRREAIGVVETIKVCEDANIRTLSLSNIIQQNQTGTPFPLMTNQGNIGKLYMYNVDPGNDVLLNNEGTIGEIIRQ